MMTISGKLAHKVQNRLQLLMGYFDLAEIAAGLLVEMVEEEKKLEHKGDVIDSRRQRAARLARLIELLEALKSGKQEIHLLSRLLEQETRKIL